MLFRSSVKKILLSLFDNGISKIVLINTVTGTQSTIKESKDSFLLFMDFNVKNNKLLFKQLKKGKINYFKTIVNYNVTTALPINQLDSLSCQSAINSFIFSMTPVSHNSIDIKLKTSRPNNNQKLFMV